MLPPKNLPQKALPSSPAPDQVSWEEVPTIETVDAIVALADPVIRNLQITQSYCELSQATSRLVGSAANWSPMPPGPRSRPA